MKVVFFFSLISLISNFVFFSLSLSLSHIRFLSFSLTHSLSLSLSFFLSPSLIAQDTAESMVTGFTEMEEEYADLVEERSQFKVRKRQGGEKERGRREGERKEG